MIGHIFKYKISGFGRIVEIELPQGYVIFDINQQGSGLFLWALIDIHAPMKTVKFVVHGTGWKIDDVENLFFLQTVHMPSGLVWHVFSVIEDEV